MTTASRSSMPRLKYHRDAYEFVNEALQLAQQVCRRIPVQEEEHHEEHITGRELLEGVRMLAPQKFGLMTLAVFRHWGLNSTEDVGRIVFELVERGELKKTERDHIGDFLDVYDFQDVFDCKYGIDTSAAFRG